MKYGETGEHAAIPGQKRQDTSAAAWKAVFPRCRQHAGPVMWNRLREKLPQAVSLPALLNCLGRISGHGGTEYLKDLARLEWMVHQVSYEDSSVPGHAPELKINPTLEMLDVSWTGLDSIVNRNEKMSARPPEAGNQIVMIWKNPATGTIDVKTPSPENLLVLKMAAEGLDAGEVAAEGRISADAVDAAVNRAISAGLLIAPKSGIRRDPAHFKYTAGDNTPFTASPVFTLQWHITQACDLHCKHCYDRSRRSPLTRDQGLAVLDDLRDFCRERHVRGQVTFTGGNPLLSPHFMTLYEAAVERGLAVAIMGNPAPKETMETIMEIKRPLFFQVSLEGLAGYNDFIRGSGHYSRVMNFLGTLKELKIHSKVMLTLNRDNMDQVLSLAEILRHRTDRFSFNRLSTVGEGANLHLPEKEAFRSFLKAYVDASRRNPVMGWKESFINILRHRNGEDLFGGCTGYGCGAAFNFLSLLSDGEVRACNKFPSPVGNIFEKRLNEIYDSPQACQYRSAPGACRGCPLYNVCRGCLAAAFNSGLDIFKAHDPYCFFTESPAPF